MTSKRNLFKVDTFVETRVVKDYNGFLKVVSFDADTVRLIQELITDEEVYIINWRKVGESLSEKQ